MRRGFLPKICPATGSIARRSDIVWYRLFGRHALGASSAVIPRATISGKKSEFFSRRDAPAVLALPQESSAREGPLREEEARHEIRYIRLHRRPGRDAAENL